MLPRGPEGLGRTLQVINGLVFLRHPFLELNKLQIHGAKSLNNLTVADMLRVQLETMGVLDTGRQQGGAGGNGGNGGGGGAAVNLSLARTKVEADEMIEKQLMSQGHAKSDADWYERFSEARKANKALLDTLPLN